MLVFFLKQNESRICFSQFFVEFVGFGLESDFHGLFLLLKSFDTEPEGVAFLLLFEELDFESFDDFVFVLLFLVLNLLLGYRNVYV